MNKKISRNFIYTFLKNIYKNFAFVALEYDGKITDFFLRLYIGFQQTINYRKKYQKYHKYHKKYIKHKINKSDKILKKMNYLEKQIKLLIQENRKLNQLVIIKYADQNTQLTKQITTQKKREQKRKAIEFLIDEEEDDYDYDYEEDINKNKNENKNINENKNKNEIKIC